MALVLSSPRLRRLIMAYAVNRLGTWVGTIAISLAVFAHTHSALAVAATLISGQVVPAFAVPPLVARVEASRRGHELSALYVFEAIATAGLAALLWSFWLPAVLVLVALDGTAALAASALQRAAAARLAREEQERLVAAGLAVADGPAPDAERAANAVINVAFSASFVAGPVLGGVIVAAWGASAALFLDAATFAICGLMLFDLRPPVEEAREDSVLTRLRAATTYIRQTPGLQWLIVTQGIALVFFESAAPIQVAYAKGTLHAGDRGFGLLVTVWGVGVALGSAIFARASERPLLQLVSAGTLAVGAAYVGYAVAPTLAVACIAAVVGGVGNGIQWAPLVSAIQKLTPSELHGRVLAALESVGAVAPAIGLALGGALVALASPRTAFLVVGLAATLTTILFLRTPAPSSLTGKRDRTELRSRASEP